jgi:hypothetical protein
MSDHQGAGQHRKLVKVFVAAVVVTVLGQAGFARALYPRAAWEADIPSGAHSVEALVTIVNERTLQVEHFTYDGTAPLVYFYLGASDDDTAFENGLQLEPLLDRPYNDESLILNLPGGETLDGYNAISVWCAQFSVNFGSASFTAPTAMYERAGWVADIPLGFHLVEGQATIISDRIIHVENFTYDGTAPQVYFYLGATDNDDDFQNGLQVPPQLVRAYEDESLVLLLPEGTTLDGYGAISVWCVQVSVNFSSASFVNPMSAVEDWAVVPTRFALYANVPNPFNPATLISYSLPGDGFVSLVIYSVDGRVVQTLVHEQQPMGRYEIIWNGEDENGRRVASGTYLYRLNAGQFTEQRKMTLVK